jgi:signal transduction histidine kinase
MEATSLASALRELAERCTFTLGVPCVASGVEIEASLDATYNLYMIAHEATTNAIRHGRASVIRIRTTREGSRCTMTIEDDGVGIDVVAARGSGGMGLVNMKQRARLIGAKCEVEPQKSGTQNGTQNGTIVRCTWWMGERAAPPRDRDRSHR